MKQLDIILPVYNEKKIIEKVLREWNKVLGKSISYSFIICEDGSTDGTKEKLKNLQRKYPLVLNQKNYRRGYGRAVLDGIASSTALYVLCVDSDGQCDPRDFKKFWKKKSKTDVLIGWRTFRSDNAQRKLFSFLFGCVFKMLFPHHIHDPSAPYVLFRKKTILPYLSYLEFLKEGFWWGFVGTCVKKNLSLYEIPINHRRRFSGETQVYQPGKMPQIVLTNLQGLWRLRMKE